MSPIPSFDPKVPTLLIGGPGHGELRSAQDRHRLSFATHEWPPSAHYGDSSTPMPISRVDYEPEYLQLKHGPLTLSGWVWLFRGLKAWDPQVARLAMSVMVAAAMEGGRK